MSDNEKLVKYFVQAYLSGNSKNLSHAVAPSFCYYINHGDQQNFDQFIERMQLLTTTSKVWAGEIKTEDGIHFYYEIAAMLPAPNEGKTAKGFAQAIVHNGLIARLDVHYNESPEEFEEFQNILSSSISGQPQPPHAYINFTKWG